MGRREGGKEGGAGLRRGPVMIIVVVDLVFRLEHITCHSLHLWWEKHRSWNKMTITF